MPASAGHSTQKLAFILNIQMNNESILIFFLSSKLH